MAPLDLTTKSSSADLDSCHDRPVPTYSFALMPTQMLRETRDPLLLLSDTVMHTYAHMQVQSFKLCQHMLQACSIAQHQISSPSRSVLAAVFVAQRAVCCSQVILHVVSSGPPCLCWDSCKDNGASNHSPYRYNQNPITGAVSRPLCMLLYVPALCFFRHCMP